MHGEAEFGIIPFDRVEVFVYADFCIQFFADFADESLLVSLSRLNFATGPFPPILPFAIAALGGEYLVSFADDGCNNFYSFHSSDLHLFFEENFPKATVVRSNVDDDFSCLQREEVVLDGVFGFPN